MTVHGTVLSKSDDEPLIGASVIAEGTDKGVTTDYDGNFSINVAPALSLTDDNNESRFSTYYVEDGSYVKMKYLKLSYSLPSHIIVKIGASNLDVYAQLENVFTITKYTGLDPEILPGEYGARIDNGAYPRPRTFSLGLNIQF